MGLFSRKKKQEPAKPAVVEPEDSSADDEIDLAECMRRAPLQFFSLGQQQVLLRNMVTGDALVADTFSADLLRYCNSFETLEDHANEIAQAMRLNPAEVDSLIGQLEDLHARGMLMSHPDVVAGCAEQSGGTGAEISTVGITTRDRPDALLRCAGSFVDNLRASGRSCELAVFDDATDPQGRASCRQAVASIDAPSAVTISYAGLDEKKRYTRTLAERSQVPGELIEFAFFDPFECLRTIGANRNALMMHSAGAAYLGVDDDVICTFASSLEPLDGVGINSLADPTSFHVFPDRAEAFAAADFEPVDVLAMHESLLGKSAADFMTAADYVDLDFLGDEVMHSLLSGESTARATMVGLVGDSGMASPGRYLRFGAEARQRLVGTEARYEQLRLSREVFRSVQRPTLNSSRFFMTPVSGIDNRTLCPPFFPVLRNSDGAFAMLLTRCFPKALIGHLPWAVRHEPPVERRFAESDRLLAVGVAPRLAEYLHALVSTGSLSIVGTEPSQRMNSLGQQLTALGALTSDSFVDVMREPLMSMVAGNMAALDELLTRHNNQPAYWADDVLRCQEQTLSKLEDGTLPLPSDLMAVYGDAERTQQVTQQLLATFGRLLCAWPTLVEASLELAAEGVRVAQPIDS